MPTTKKRINLAVSDEVYTRITAYKEKNGIVNDATACLQLILAQLRSQDEMDALMKVINGVNMNQLVELSKIGLQSMKDAETK